MSHYDLQVYVVTDILSLDKTNVLSDLTKNNNNNIEPKTTAEHRSVVAVKVVITDCSPLTVVVNFQTSFMWQSTASQSHCQ